VIRVVQITDRRVLARDELFARIARAGDAKTHRGSFVVLLRDKDLPRDERAALARSLRDETRAAGAALVVAADVALAAEVGADGAHLPSDRADELMRARSQLGPTTWLSIACHAPDEVARAARHGASAALLSPIFQSPGKGSPIGIAALREARRLLPLGASCALVALGGVDRENAKLCLDEGADGVASIRADLTQLLVAG
jgi:thiamine-phosphate pyrophosphorylase